MARTAFLLACFLSLSGCGTAVLTFVGTNMATVVHAENTIPDIILSSRSGKNCSLLHASRNEPYCQSAPPDPTKVLAELASNRYCYRTLGRIDCYTRPDFLASGYTRVNFATGYLPDIRTPAPKELRSGKHVSMAGLPGPAEAIAAPPAAASAAPPAAVTQGTMGPNPAVKAVAEDVPGQRDAAPRAPSAVPPDLMDPGLTGTPVAQVPPLGALPSEGTY